MSGVFAAPNVLIPRIQNVDPKPGTPERRMETTPASCPARLFDIFATGALISVTETVAMAPTTLAFFWTP